MSLSRNDVEKIAHLARLAIDESDVDGYASELSNILGLVDEMNESAEHERDFGLPRPVEMKVAHHKMSRATDVGELHFAFFQIGRPR